MDKFSELKRMAEKCPVQRFEPFIGRAGGRGTQAIFNADTKGEVITWSGFDSSDVASRTGREAIARFVAAADPETVRTLLAGLEAKDKRIAELERSRFIAWTGNMFAPVLARIKVDVKRRDGSMSVGQSAGNVIWYHSNSPSDVVAFALAVEGDDA